MNFWHKFGRNHLLAEITWDMMLEKYNSFNNEEREQISFNQWVEVIIKTYEKREPKLAKCLRELYDEYKGLDNDLDQVIDEILKNGCDHKNTEMYECKRWNGAYKKSGTCPECHQIVVETNEL